MNDNRVGKNVKRLALSGLLLLALLGCSGIGALISENPAAPPAAEPLAACSLLTEAEWEALVGPSPVAPEQTDDEATYVTPPVQTSLCSYASRQGSVLLAVERPHTMQAADSKALAAQLRQDPGLTALGEVNVQPLDGLGVPAAWYDVRQSAGQVWVVAVSPSGGGAYLRVQAFNFPLEQAQAIAEAALSRLP